MTHLLPPLPYDLHGLEPSISAETLALHHDKHHRGYVDKLNAAIKAYPQYQKFRVDELLRRLDSIDPAVREDVRKHGGGHANHSLFWQTMTPQGQAPSTTLSHSLENSFHSFEGLKQAFHEAADHVFGSGWVFLTCGDARSRLEITALPNQDSPLSHGATPLLAFDLWEHAYYLQYRNERPHWIDAWWDVIDWRVVERNLDQAHARHAA